MRRWFEAAFAVLLLLCWLAVARTADGALRDNDAARQAAQQRQQPQAELVAAATGAAPRGR